MNQYWIPLNAEGYGESYYVIQWANNLAEALALVEDVYPNRIYDGLGRELRNEGKVTFIAGMSQIFVHAW